MMRILIADDHPATVDMLSRFVQTFLPEATTAFVDSGDSILAKLGEESSIDLLIQDLSMLGTTRRFNLVRAVREKRPELPIILYTLSVTPAVLRAALNCGVGGIVSKGSGLKQLAFAIEDVTTGGSYIDPSLSLRAAAMHPWFDLTADEREVVLLTARGTSTRDICEMTNRAYMTVATHKANALGKLGLSSPAEFALYIYEHGLDFEFDGMPRPSTLTAFA